MGRQASIMELTILSFILLILSTTVTMRRMLSVSDSTNERHVAEPSLQLHENQHSRPVRQVFDTPLMPYRYGYAVQDAQGNDFNQQEESDGFQVTGQYSVLLPDGRVQTVSYSVAPDTGYVAEVAFDGSAGPVFIDANRAAGK